jgi:hypothetical protein
MLDDLRNSSSFIEEEEPEVEQQQVVRRYPTVRRRASSKTFLGMTAPQRFFLSLVLFLMVLMLGLAALIATGSLYLSF